MQRRKANYGGLQYVVLFFFYTGFYLFLGIIKSIRLTNKCWTLARLLLKHVRIRTHTILVLAWRWLARPRPRRSRLLELPAEVRLRIWSDVVDGDYALIQTKRELWSYHGPKYSFEEIQIGEESGDEVMDDDAGDNYWDGTDRTVDHEGIQVQQERRAEERYWDAQQRSWARVKAWRKCVGYRGKHLDGWGLLRTCKLIYREAYPLLFAHTRFILTHDAKSDILPPPLPFTLFNQIQILHLHLRFNERYHRCYDWTSRYPVSDLYIYAKQLDRLKSLPHLRDLSIYAEGPLVADMYRRLFRDCDDIAEHFGEQMKRFTVRVPRPGVIWGDDEIRRVYTEPMDAFLRGWKGERWTMVLPDEGVVDVPRDEEKDAVWRGGVMFHGGRAVQYRMRSWCFRYSWWERDYDL